MERESHAEHENNRYNAAPNIVLAVLATLVLVVDQVAKRVVIDTLGHGQVVTMLGGSIQLDFTANTGAAFGLFRNAGMVFVAVAVAVTSAAVAYRRKIAQTPWPVRAALGMIVGGALSNAVDRVRLGYVVDFIDLRWWPVFNLADSAIVVGAVLLTVNSYWTPRRDNRV